VSGSHKLSRFKISLFKFVQGTIVRTPEANMSSPSPPSILSSCSFPESQSHPSSINPSIPIEPTKLYKTSHSSAVILVYPQTNSVLFICIFPANNLLTAIYHPQNSPYLPLLSARPALFLFSHYPPGYQHLQADIFHSLEDNCGKRKTIRIDQPPSRPNRYYNDSLKSWSSIPKVRCLQG